uniref:F-box domain-containing protein n=1 Tax=Ditylenchus dipsaci TaxID=166011 RepID=A0A915EH49_9BILA
MSISAEISLKEQSNADWSQAMHDYIKHVENLNESFVNSKNLSTSQKDTPVATSDLIEPRPVGRRQHLINWDCPTCGKVNLSIHLICSCGVDRPLLPVTQCYIEKLMIIDTTEGIPELPDIDDTPPDSPPSFNSLDEMAPVLSSSISGSKQIFESNIDSQVATTSLNSSNVPPARNVTLCAPLLTDILGFFSRHRLELMSVTCSLINSLVNLYFGQHPYRRFKTHELDIFIDDRGLPLFKLHIHIHFTYSYEIWNWPEPRDDILSLDPELGTGQQMICFSV